MDSFQLEAIHYPIIETDADRTTSQTTSLAIPACFMAYGQECESRLSDFR